jgi:hypothetical protein
MADSPQALMPEPELDLLRAVHGEYAQSLLATPIECFIRIRNEELRIGPEGEIGRSPADAREELMRVKAEMTALDPVWREGCGGKVIALESAISSITLLRGLVLFGVPSASEPEILYGMSLPAGIEYDVMLRHPSQLGLDATAIHATHNGMANLVDRAVVFGFSNGRRVVIGTDGWSYHLTWAMDDAVASWLKHCEPIHVAGAIPLGPHAA